MSKGGDYHAFVSMRFPLAIVLLLTAPSGSAPTPPAGCTVAADCQLTQKPVLECRKRAPASPMLANDSAVCRCDFPSGRCRFAWEGPVPCAQDADCTWGRDDQHEAPLPARVLPSRRSKRPRACADHVFSSCDPQARVCVLHIPAC